MRQFLSPEIRFHLKIVQTFILNTFCEVEANLLFLLGLCTYQLDVECK